MQKTVCNECGGEEGVRPVTVRQTWVERTNGRGVDLAVDRHLAVEGDLCSTCFGIVAAMLDPESVGLGEAAR